MSAIKRLAPVIGTAAGTAFGGPLGGTLGGALGGMIAGNAQRGDAAAGATSAGQQGSAAAAYHPVNSYNPYGSVTNGPNGMNVQLNPEMQSRERMFGNMATGAANLAGQAGQQIGGAGQMFNNLGQQYAQGAQGAGANFTGAGNRMLQAMGNFDPQQYANQAYGNMAAMAAPGMTDQTQNMLNYEQASGRGGLQQNGQLGDLGGLALAQKTADNQMRMQAMQMGQSQQQLMGNQASQFAGTGANQTRNYADIGGNFANMGNTQQNSAVGRYGDLSQIAGNNSGYANNIGQQMIPYANMANNQANDMAAAGGRQGDMLYGAQMTRNNINGAYNGGMNSQLGDTFNQLGTAAGNWLSGKFGNNGQPTGQTGYDAYTTQPTMPSFNFGSGSMGQYGSWYPQGH